MAEQIVKVKVDLDVAEFNKNAKAMSDALSSILGKDVELFNGKIRNTKKYLDDTEKSFKNVENTVKGAGDSVKKSNQQWTNLALVIQDLPFGFRGIQNNLPALMGGLAGVGSAAYVAFSAIVALYTAYGQEINDAIFKTTNFEKAQKELTKSTIESAKSTESARSEILKVTSVVDAAKNGFIAKSAALEYYNEKLGDSFGKVGSLAEAEQNLVNKAPKYIEALMLKAKAEYYFAKASEYAVKKDIAGLEDQTTALDKLSILANTISKFGDATGVRDIIRTLVEGIGQAQTKGVEKVKKTAGEISAVLEAEGKKTMSSYFAALKQSGLSDKEIQAIIENLNKKSLKSQAEAEREREKQAALEAKARESEIKSYGDSLTKRDKEEYDAGVRLQKDLATMRAAGFTDSSVYYATYRANMLEIANKYDELERAALEKKNSERVARQKEIDGEVNAIVNRGLQNELDAIHIAAQNGLKLSKGSRQGQIDALNKEREALLQLKAASGWEPEQLDKINDALVRNSASLEVYADQWGTTAQKISDIIQNMISDTFTMFAQSLGKIFAGQDVDVFGNIINIIGSGLEEIGKALIAYGLAMEAFKNAFANPFAAVAAGFALVAAGSYLKASISKTSSGDTGVQAFANGGIISGPTMGLMGEYPGAQSNPEVVAPLDKLKEMIGGNGGGGTFVLRGQDLLVAVNRAQKASSLKGQNISLA